MPTTAQEPIPFAVEMEWGNFAQRYCNQLRRQIRRQLSVALDGPGRQPLGGMLAKELL
jgi:hypothetical protein